MKDIKSFTFEELRDEMRILGEKDFRAVQLYSSLHKKLLCDFDGMTDISLKLREKLKAEYGLNILKPVRILKSELDGTVKFLYELHDKNVVEGVLMRYKYGNSACISTQAGCRMGCVFCASAIGGLVRNLEAYEMLEEIYCMERTGGEKISNIVLMGSGEPLDNYDNVIRFIRLISAPEGLNISPRNITLSTCGIVPRIYDLAGEGIPLTLAISLHAPDDAIRRTLMPVAKAYGISDIIKACRYYFDKTGRRITFEYSLVPGVNDKKEHAVLLCGLLKGLNCHVNLIPVNPVKECIDIVNAHGQGTNADFSADISAYLPMEKSAAESMEKSEKNPAAGNFQRCLVKNGINATVRRELGRDISGSCGQLRRRHMDSVMTDGI